MGIVVEQRHIDAARLAGACGELDAIRPGMAVEDVKQPWLIWFAERCPDLAREIEEAAKLPIWALSGSGYGYGDGGGYGYGSGGGYGSSRATRAS